MRFEIPWMPLSVSFMSFSVSSSWRFRVVVGRRLLFQVIEWNRTYETWMDARVATKSTSENGKMDKHIHVARRIVVSRKCVGRPLASRQSSRIFKSFLFKTVLHLKKCQMATDTWLFTTWIGCIEHSRTRSYSSFGKEIESQRDLFDLDTASLLLSLPSRSDQIQPS